MPTIDEILKYAPPFPEPHQLDTKDQMARWLTWQRYRCEGLPGAVYFYNALMTWEKDSLVKRCDKWLATHCSICAARIPQGSGPLCGDCATRFTGKTAWPTHTALGPQDREEP